MRRLRRALRGLTLRRVGVWYHPSYRVPLSGILGTIGMSPRRADDALTWLLDERIVGRTHEAPRVRWADVERVHDPGWIERLDRPQALAGVLGVEMGRALPADELLETWRRATGGTVAAARWALRTHRPAVNLMGGFHHAFPDRGYGFCPIDDVAIAVARLRSDGWHGRVVIVDLDAHPPDGTAACLDGARRVHIGSLGVASSWEAGPRVLDARLPAGTGDAGYLRALDELLAELPRPGLVIYLAGADPLVGDRLGGLACTEVGLRERDRRVFAWAGRRPIVALPGGGYTEHAWRVLAGTVAEAAGASLSVPPGYDPVRRRTVDIARTLDPDELQGNLGITAADVFGDIAGAPGQRRFLDYYTRHGLEYALERYGILPALRRMGFEDLRLAVDAGEEPHRLRVTADVDGRRELLVDAALSVRELEGWRLLFVEWLELRDPRIRFTKAQLPGQEVPGLGLATEVGHVLLRCAERLGLAGVAVVPSWFHVAWMARADFRALDPEAQGRFEALVEHLAAEPLAEATRRLAGDGVPSTAGPVRWEPVPFVRPVDPELMAALAARSPRTEAARQRWRAALGHPGGAPGPD